MISNIFLAGNQRRANENSGIFNDDYNSCYKTVLYDDALPIACMLFSRINQTKNCLDLVADPLRKSRRFVVTTRQFSIQPDQLKKYQNRFRGTYFLYIRWRRSFESVMHRSFLEVIDSSSAVDLVYKSHKNWC